MGSDRRRAARIPCRLPVRIKGHGTPCLAYTKDLSRVGVCLGLPRSQLALPPDADVQQLVRGVNDRLGPVVVAEFHYEVLGALVRKGLRLVRMALPVDDPGHIELGFEFSHAMTEEETSFLGVDLPGVEEHAEVPDAEIEPAAPLCVYLCPAEDAVDVVPLLAPVVHHGDTSMVVRVGNPRCLPLMPMREDVGGRFEVMAAAYGSRARLLVVHGARPVWFGEASVQAVYRPTARGGFDVELVFDRHTGPAARLRTWSLPDAAEAEPSAPREAVSAE